MPWTAIRLKQWALDAKLENDSILCLLEVYLYARIVNDRDPKDIIHYDGRGTAEYVSFSSIS